MRIQRNKPFRKDFGKLSKELKRRTVKSLDLLLKNSYHPSLRVKKTKGQIFKGYKDVFEGRITKDYRFFFLIKDDTFYLLRCGKHDEFFK